MLHADTAGGANISPTKELHTMPQLYSIATNSTLQKVEPCGPSL